MRSLFQKYPILITALLLVLISFPDVILGKRSLMVTDAVPFDGTSAYVTAEGREKIRSLYYETKKNTAQGFFDAGGSLWQSESKIPFMRYVIKNGESPFWNPYQGAGTLGSETLVDLKFSPLTILAAMFGGSSKAYNFTILFFLTLSTYCMIKLCTQLFSLPRLAGVAAALAFIFNGFQTSGLAMNYAQSYLLFPIVLYSLCAWVKYGGIAYFIMAYVACALVLCLTFLPTTALTLVAVAALAAAFALQQPVSISRKMVSVFGIGAALFAGLLMTAVLYLPIALALSENKELGVYAARVFYPVTLNGLLSVFSPKHIWNSYVTMNGELLANSSEPYFVGNNTLFHIGLVGGLLALFSFNKHLLSRPILLGAWSLLTLFMLREFGIALYPHPENSAFTGGLVIRGILLAGLLYTLFFQKEHWTKLAFIPVWVIVGLVILRLLGISYYDSAFDKIPMLGSFGAQYIWVVIMICLPIIVAYGMSNLMENNMLFSRTKYFLIFIFMLLASVIPNYPFEIMSKQNMVRLVAFAVFCYAIYYLYKKQVSGAGLKYLPLLVLSLLFVEYNYYVNHSRPERSKLYRHVPDYVAFIKEHIGNQRILNLGHMGLPAEQASAYQIQDISTMTNSAPPDYIDFYLKYLVPKEYKFFDILTNLQVKDTAQINLKMVSFMGVKYILVQKDWPVWNKFLQEQLTPAFSSQAISVYENPEAWPRAFFTSESPEKLVPESVENGLITKQNVVAAEITRYNHDTLTISVDAPKAGTLVLTDNWHRYWFATVNGVDTPVDKVFGAFRGVSVPAGNSTIEFTYKNPAVIYGLKVTEAMLIVTAILSLIAFARFAFDRTRASAKKSIAMKQPKIQGLS